MMHKKNLIYIFFIIVAISLFFCGDGNKLKNHLNELATSSIVNNKLESSGDGYSTDNSLSASSDSISFTTPKVNLNNIKLVNIKVNSLITSSDSFSFTTPKANLDNINIKTSKISNYTYINYIKDIAEFKGYIYVGSTAGIYRFKKSQLFNQINNGNTTVEIEIFNPFSLNVNTKKLKVIDDKLFLISKTLGNFQFDGNKWKIIDESNSLIKKLKEEKEITYLKKTYILSQNKLFFKKGNDEIEKVKMSDYPINDIIVFKDDFYLATYGGGLRLLTNPYDAIPNVPEIIEAFEIIDNTFIIGTSKGLYIVSDEGDYNKIFIDGLPNNNISCIESTNKGLWIGFFDKGISFFNGESFKHITDNDGLPSNWINSICFNNGLLYVATDKGLSYIDANTFKITMDESINEWVNFVSIIDNIPYITYLDNVLYRQNNAWKKIEIENDKILVFEKGYDDSLWLGGMNALYNIKGSNIKTYSAIQKNFNGRWITSIKYTNEKIYIGTYDNGVASIKKGFDDFNFISNDVWVNQDTIQKIGAYLIVGTLEEGLKIYKDGRYVIVNSIINNSLVKLKIYKDEELIHIGKKDGICGDDVTGVTFNGKSIWIGTREGLSKIQILD